MDKLMNRAEAVLVAMNGLCPDCGHDVGSHFYEGHGVKWPCRVLEGRPNHCPCQREVSYQSPPSGPYVLAEKTDGKR